MAYREADSSTARFVCTVCMRTASSVASDCPLCNVTRPPLSNPAVVIELRKRVEQKRQRRDAQQWALVIGGATIVTICIYLVTGELGGLDITPHLSRASLRFQLVHPIFFLLWFGVLIPLSLAFKRRQPARPDVRSLAIGELLWQLGITLDN
jgi:hypothetical protein